MALHVASDFSTAGDRLDVLPTFDEPVRAAPAPRSTSGDDDDQQEEDEATQGGETVTECRKISFQRSVVSKSVTWSHQTSEMKAKNSMLRTRGQI